MAARKTRKIPEPVADRFWRFVDKRGPDECWPWTGSRWKDNRGKGMMQFDDFSTAAPRASWFVHYGVWPPKELFVCHTCDNPPCVNPAHLFLGTRWDNAKDMVAKGRSKNQRKTHCIAGHPFSGDNLLLLPLNRRGCRACVAIRNERRRMGLSRSLASAKASDGEGA